MFLAGNWSRLQTDFTEPVLHISSQTLHCWNISSSYLFIKSLHYSNKKKNVMWFCFLGFFLARNSCWLIFFLQKKNVCTLKILNSYFKIKFCKPLFLSLAFEKSDFSHNIMYSLINSNSKKKTPWFLLADLHLSIA